MAEEEIIQFIGVKDLSESEKEIVNRLSAEYYEKVKRSLNNITSMAVHVKTHNDEGGQKRYELNIRAISPSHVFESKKDSDWDLARALHKSFKNIEHEIEHRLKVSDQDLHK